MKSFNNKVAAITGAGSGMGRALAKSLASRGCHLGLADINESALEETAERLQELQRGRHYLYRRRIKQGFGIHIR